LVWERRARRELSTAALGPKLSTKLQCALFMCHGSI
jgi:hypothetical protein